MTDVLPSTELRFVVFGRAQGKGSKRALPVRGRPGAIVMVDSNRNAKPWANAVADKAREAAPVYGWVSLVRGPVAVTLSFFFARPRSHFGTGRNAGAIKESAPPHMVTMPDLDKLARCTLDALTGTLIKDDAQIALLHCGKFYGEPERAEIRVRELSA